ncbi:MAG: tetratricopeptide repeat protein, partial [Deltaproteobacteria bacterium]|nr:tetratricopeptide repeat protein [Deltaproteobacteria bacterium]
MALKEQLLDRAQKYVLKGNIDKALGEYKAAFELDPRDISVRLKIGDLYVKSGRKAEAIKEYTEVAKANAQRGFYLKAIAVYKQALKLDSSNMEIHYKLADLYVKQRLIADAISSYSHILSVFEKKGKTNEVLEIVKKMVEVDPDNIGVRLKLADLYQKMSFDKDALEEYSFIFEKLLSQGKFDVAEKIYVGLYNNNPKEQLVIKGLSDLYKKKGDSREHLRFSKALFNIYRENGDIEEAKEICSSILKMKPEDPDALGFMARFRPAEEKRVDPPFAPEPTAAQALITEPSRPIVPEPVVEEAPSIEEAPVQEREAAAPDEQAEAPLISLPEDIEITLEGFEEGDGEEGQRADLEGAGRAQAVTEEAGEGGGLDIREAFLKAPVAETEERGVAEESAGAEVEIELPVDIELTPETGEPEAEITSKVEEAVEKAEAAPEVAQEPLLEAAPEPVVSEKVEIELEAEVASEAAQEPVVSEQIELEAEAAPEVAQEPLLEAAPEPVVSEKVEIELEAEVAP